jgi:hypothetical protein
MQPKVISAVAAIGLALCWAGAASSDGGNTATNSIGTAQVSSITSDPAAAVDSTAATASASLPVNVTGDGGNSADQSIGTVQAGGGNTADRSAATVQVSPTAAAPSATAKAGGQTASVDAGVTAGHTPNSSRHRIARVQAGRPNAHVTARVAHASVTITAPATKGTPSVTVSPGSSLTPSVDYTPVVHLRIRGNLFSLTMRPELEVAPGVMVGIDQLVTAALGGGVQLGPNAGSTAEKSLATLQVGAVTIAPTLTVASPALGLALVLAGGSSVDGGSSSALKSLGTAQAGGGNSADRSAGTLQVGGITVGPSLNLWTWAGTVSLAGDTGIAGGANEATRSLGTVQIGGGNKADHSIGTAQSGPVGSNETATYTDTPAGSGTVGGPTQIGGNGGNTATDSAGTGQIAGGNNATGSIGTAQSGPIGTAAGVTFTDSPAGSGTVGSPTQIGGNGDNTATDSAGTGQIGGGNSATGSIVTGQVGGNTSGPTPPEPTPPGPQQPGNDSVVLSEQPSAALPSPAGTSQSPSTGVAGTTASSTNAATNAGSHANRTTRPGTSPAANPNGVAGTHKAAGTSPGTSSSGNLPFTGLPLWPFLFGAALLLLAGTLVRRGARDPR